MFLDNTKYVKEIVARIEAEMEAGKVITLANGDIVVSLGSPIETDVSVYAAMPAIQDETVKVLGKKYPKFTVAFEYSGFTGVWYAHFTKR